MIHIRTDNQELNDNRTFACGIGPKLPDGDKYYYATEFSADRADCPGCNPGGPRPYGTPISELSGRYVPPGHPDREKYDRFVEIGESWGYP